MTREAALILTAALMAAEAWMGMWLALWGIRA